MEKIYLVALIICLSMIVVALGVGFYFYYQTIVKPATNNVNNSGLPNGNQVENSADKIKQQSLPLILKTDNQDFIKIWAEEKTSLGAKPTLHVLLDEAEQMIKNNLKEPAKLVGIFSVCNKSTAQDVYYQFSLRYQSQSRKWGSVPAVYVVNYNYDITKCADDQNNLVRTCVNEPSQLEVPADVFNQTIVVSEFLTPMWQKSLSDFAIIQPEDIKLDIPDILTTTNKSDFGVIRFAMHLDNKRQWTIFGRNITDSPQVILEK